MIVTITALLIRIFSNPVANVFQKKLTGRNHDPLLVNFIAFFTLGIVCIAPALSIDWRNVSVEAWGYGLIAGVFGAVGNGFLVKALKSGDLSILGPINSYKSVVGLIVGIVVLHEIPNIWGLIGMVIIIWGSYFVLDTMPEGFSWKLLKNKEIQYRIWAMVLTATEAIFIKKVILYSSTTISFLFWCWFGALFSLLLLFVFKVKLPKGDLLRKSSVGYYSLLAVCIGLMQFTTNYVFAHMDVGYALALFQLSTLVSVFLGYRLFKESDIKKKLIGSVIMIVGSVVIIFLN